MLISSINWGDSAMVRNREMGLIVTSTEVAAPYIDSWYADWNRLDNVTDSDNDGMPDIFEVNFGLNRTVSMHNGLLEAEADNDNDGLSNLDEYTLGGHPLNPDTDGDCILDAVEVSWAQATALDPSVSYVSPHDASNLADADGDGIPDSKDEKPREAKKKKGKSKEDDLARIADKKESIDFKTLGTASEDDKDDLKNIKGIGPFL